MTPSKRLFAILAAVLLCMTINSHFSYCETDALGIESDIYEQSKDKYLTEYRENYRIDAQELKSLKEFLQKFIYFLMNFILMLHTLLVKLTIVILDFAVNFDMYSLCSFVIEPILDTFKETLFDEISLIFISVYGLSILIKMIKNQNTQAYTSIIQLLIIIVAALIFFNYPVQLLKAVDTGTKYVSSKVLEGPQAAISNEEKENVTASGRAASLIWQIALHKPWQIVNFGSEKTANEHEEALLKTKPETKEREKLVKELSKQGLFSKSLGSASAKFATLCIMCFFTLLICILTGAISFFILMYQFLTILYMMGGVFVFIVALLPFVGMRAVYIWAEKVLSTASIKIVIVFCLAVVLTFMHIIYQAIDEYGLIKALMLQVLIIVTIYFKREEIIKTFLNFGIVAGKPQYAVERAIRNEVDIENKAKAYVLKRNKENSTKEINTPRLETHRSHNNLRKMEQSATSIRKSTQDIGTYMKKAEELLHKQYDKSVEKTEKQKSDPRHKKAEQSSFVKRTNAIRELGVGSFDQRDITKAAKQLKRIEESGGDINKVINHKKKRSQKIKRPKQLKEVGTRQREQEKSITPQNENIKIPSDQAFNNTFKTNYDKEYFDSLSDEYGKGTVKLVIENMVKQQTKKKGSIQSPAYHLVKTLENKTTTENKTTNKPVSMRKSK